MEQIEIIKPDDWHVHFRDGEILKAVVPETSQNFSRAIVMPNLVPPILNSKQAIRYKKSIEKVIPHNHNFQPLLTVYLTEKTCAEDLKSAFNNKEIFAVKLYPAGATTNSESGVKDINKVMPILEIMAEIGLPLLIHGEVTNHDVDIFDREKVFIDKKLDFICKNLPELKITLEHITTKDASVYIKEGNENLAASITPHHLTLNRNAIFVGGIRPHNYCLPILKREIDRKALLEVAISGNKKFFLGTDTAPHFVHDKESECGCAGVFNATYCIPILAQLFENHHSINNLENFVSRNGAKHYKLKFNNEKIKLIKSSKEIIFKHYLKIGRKKIKIFNPEFPVFWQVAQ